MNFFLGALRVNTSSTQEGPFRHDLKIVDLNVKNKKQKKNNKKQEFLSMYKVDVFLFVSDMKVNGQDL